MVFFLIFLTAFFIILSIVYFSKENINEKLVIAKNVKNVQTSSELNIGVYSKEEIQSINPITSNNEIIKCISDLLYDKLFEITENNYIPNSKIVENYAQIDEKNYVFKLKENIKFRNGETFTSKNVKETIEAIFSNEYSYYFDCVDNIQSVKVIDNNMFRINLIEADNDFCKKLVFPIISQENDCGTKNYMVNEIGDGHIFLENIENGQVIKIYIYNDVQTLYREFKEKKLDIIKPVELVDFKKYIGEFGYIDKSYKGNEYIFLKFNEEIYPKNSDLRKAILSAINCDEIIKVSLKNEAFDVKNTIFDLDKVVDLLEKDYMYKENGWYRENSLFNVNLAISKNMEKRLEIIDIIKKQLEQIGIKVNLISPTDEEYNEKINSEEYDILVDITNVLPWKIYENNEYLICNKLHMLYSSNISGKISPNVNNVFNDISSWKKIIR